MAETLIFFKSDAPQKVCETYKELINSVSNEYARREWSSSDFEELEKVCDTSVYFGEYAETQTHIRVSLTEKFKSKINDKELNCISVYVDDSDCMEDYPTIKNMLCAAKLFKAKFSEQYFAVIEARPYEGPCHFDIALFTEDKKLCRYNIYENGITNITDDWIVENVINKPEFVPIKAPDYIINNSIIFYICKSKLDTGEIRDRFSVNFQLGNVKKVIVDSTDEKLKAYIVADYGDFGEIELLDCYEVFNQVRDNLNVIAGSIWKGKIQYSQWHGDTLLVEEDAVPKNDSGISKDDFFTLVAKKAFELYKKQYEK